MGPEAPWSDSAKGGEGGAAGLRPFPLGREWCQPVYPILAQGATSQAELSQSGCVSLWPLETQTWNGLQSLGPQFLNLESGTSNKPLLGTEQVVWMKGD